MFGTPEARENFVDSMPDEHQDQSKKGLLFLPQAPTLVVVDVKQKVVDERRNPFHPLGVDKTGGWSPGLV